MCLAEGGSPKQHKVEGEAEARARVERQERMNLSPLFVPFSMVGRLARGQDALVYRIDRCGQVRWSLPQGAGIPKRRGIHRSSWFRADRSEVVGCSRLNGSSLKLQQSQRQKAQAKLYYMARLWFKRQGRKARHRKKTKEGKVLPSKSSRVRSLRSEALLKSRR